MNQTHARRARRLIYICTSLPIQAARAIRPTFPSRLASLTHPLSFLPNFSQLISPQSSPAFLSISLRVPLQPRSCPSPVTPPQFQYQAVRPVAAACHRRRGEDRIRRNPAVGAVDQAVPAPIQTLFPLQPDVGANRARMLNRARQSAPSIKPYLHSPVSIVQAGPSCKQDSARREMIDEE
jgi:hypothetical protein